MKWWRRLTTGIAMMAGGAPVFAAGLAWCEVLTSGSPADLAPFYEKTFGWAAERSGPGPRDAVLLSRAGKPVAGIVYREGARMSAPRSRWAAFFQGTAKDAAARAVEAGGREVEPAHAGAAKAWKLALLADAEGAVFGLAEPATDGAVAAGGFWPVLLTRGTARAAEFYRDILGGERVDEARTPLFPGDFLLVEEGRPWAGVQPAGVSGRAGWLVLVAVGNIDAATDAARREGGRILRAPKIDLIGGRVAVISDPAGGVFGLCEALPARVQSSPSKAAAYEVEALSR